MIITILLIYVFKGYYGQEGGKKMGIGEKDTIWWGLLQNRLGTRRRQWHPTPVLLPGKSHGLTSLVGYTPWGRKESDTIERLSLLDTVSSWTLNVFKQILGH